jgi:uncharacterized protein DUF1592/uncharacterized protein DUF1588/uncharacterized protein DUF1587/uncharacterized protein DUF1585/uncharacterized protein DUF1595/cytochrome c
MRRVPLLALILAAGIVPSAAAPEQEKPKPKDEYEEKVLPLLAKYCHKCHDATKKKGELDLTSFKTSEQVAASLEVWQKAIERVNAFEMPPEKSAQPSHDEKALLIRWFGKIPKGKLDCNQIATDRTQRFYRGYVMSRRLNRTEYANSVRDLFGVDLDAGRSIPADGSAGEGFDNNGDALFTSPILIEKYMDAADAVLAALLPDGRAPASPAIEAARRRLLPAPRKEERDAAKKIVASVAGWAFRRPVDAAEVDRYLGMFDRARGRGDSFEASLRLALKGVLISPHFLFLVEPEPKEGGVYRLGPYALAQRISYFLWSSLPDEELLRAARDGTLHEPETLRAQVRRMLKDPRSKALGESFACQWLELEALGKTVRPDAKKFPEFDDELAEAMKDEVILAFHDVVGSNRTLLELIDSPTTFVNGRLAKLYGIEGVTGREMRRVELQDRNRGGVVGMAAVLTVSSYPLRTSPVIRGKWILESLLGNKVPPPPPDAGSLAENGGETAKLSFRERLEKHRTKPECASCHQKMDPLGFGLENFDPIGRWRTLDEGRPVDSIGQLPTGEKFESPAQLKKVLLARKDEVMTHLTRKILGYALGRALNNFDKCVVDDSLKALKADGYRSSAMIETIVLSYPFQHRYAKR